jgi:TPR repeat protein
MNLGKIITATALVLVSNTALAVDGFDEGLRYYMSGKPRQALSLWRPLAESGHSNAQFHIGHLYSNGEGVSKSNTEALKWYQQAAAQGHQTANYRIRVIKMEMKILH